MLKVAFERELRALKGLHHPNIVELKDFGAEPETGNHFLVLEWMETDLATASKTRRYPGWDAYYEEMGRPILEALRFAHERYIAHRDVKPRNILLDVAGNPKLADFGISKIKTWLLPELTLNEFISRPFSPPEYDDGSFTYTRDVFSFCVLSLQCLSPTPFADYDAVHRALDGVDLPGPIFELFQQGLALDPNKRPQNASVLLAHIESIQAERSSSWIRRVPVFLEMTESAWRRLNQDFPGKSKGEISSLLSGDLNTCCGIAPYIDEVPGATPQFQLYGASLSCHVAVHRDNSAQLVVLNARSGPSALLEQRRDRALVRPVQFAFGLPDSIQAAQEGLEMLLEEVAQHEAAQKLERESQREKELFGRWASVLNLKGDLEKTRERPLPFNSLLVDEQTAVLRLTADPEEDLLGQTRCIYREDRLLLKGDVITVDGRAIRLRADFLSSDEMPSNGSLVLDNAASREALKRQKAALDDVRFDRALRSELKRLLLYPGNSEKPVPVDHVNFVQPDLDQAKREAVGKALGSTDFLLVQGPPGTGKTTFITETILQTLIREPKSRILLTSQTHVALDNAVERLQKYVQEFRVIRIGRSENSRISKTVEKLLIENQIADWRDTVIALGREYLEKWAASHGISRRHFDIATELRRICSCDELIAELGAEIENVENQIAGLRTLVTTEENLAEVQSELLHLQEQLSGLKLSRETQRKDRTRAAGNLVKLEPEAAELLSDPAEDLQSWADAYLPKTAASLKLQKLVETHTNWEVRLGRAADFESALIASSQVIAGTCVGIASIRGLRDIEFDLCIVDEASKATPTETLVCVEPADGS